VLVLVGACATVALVTSSAPPGPLAWLGLPLTTEAPVPAGHRARRPRALEPTERRALFLGFGAAAAAAQGAAGARALTGSTLSPRLEDAVKEKGGGIADFTKTPSGLRVLDLVAGKGEQCCAEGVGVTVDWSLRRGNGYFVDSSFGFDQGRGIDERFGIGQTPDLRFVPVVPVGGKGGGSGVIEGVREAVVGMRVGGSGVIEGVREAVVGMRVGGTRRVIVPPKLGYVSEDMQPMPTDWGRKRQVQRFRGQEFVLELRLKGLRP